MPSDIEPRPGQFTDFMEAWRAAPNADDGEAAHRSWMERAEWLRGRSSTDNTHKMFRAALHGVSKRLGRMGWERKQALKAEALRAGIYWTSTPEGPRVNPNWEAELAEQKANNTSEARAA